MPSPFDTAADSAAPALLQRREDDPLSSLGLHGDDWGLGTNNGGKSFFSLFYNLLLKALERDLASECRCECPTGGDPETDPFAAYQHPKEEGGLPPDVGVLDRPDTSEFGTYPRSDPDREQEASEYGEVPDSTQEPSGYERLNDPGTREVTDTSYDARPANGGWPPGVSALDRRGPTAMPDAVGVVEVNEPIVVEAGEVFDGGGKLYRAGSALGDGSQAEGQKPVFILRQGATLRNVQVEGADGVHGYGDVLLKDVWWRNVGEDAFTHKAYGHVTFDGGGAYGASDKVVQLMAGGSLDMYNFHAEGFGTAIRTNGGEEFNIDINIRDSVFLNGDQAVVRTDAQGARVTLSGVRTSGLETEVLAPDAARVSGTASVGYKPFSG